jgi:phosphoglucosamine mutase
MTRLPQVLVNVPVSEPMLDAAERLAAEIAAAERELGPHGRILVRSSGTEPLVRVMVEAPTVEQAQSTADRRAAAVRRTT